MDHKQTKTKDKSILFLVLLLVGGSIYAVRSRKIKLPTMDRISSVLNPNYNRLQDSNMVRFFGGFPQSV